jgi:esterase/lipase superfamily enzyme
MDSIHAAFDFGLGDLGELLFLTLLGLAALGMAIREQSRSRRATIVRVHYGTDRAQEVGPDGALGYGGERGRGLALGFADVSIPPAHQRGHIERPSIWRLEYRESPEKHVMLLTTCEAPEEEFFTSLRAELSERGQESTFVFVHGYNMAFSEAVRRTAQLGYDLGLGAPLMFSWPSRGTVADYIADGTSAEWSVPHLLQFLEAVQVHSGARSIHLIAHSLGNRVLTEVLAALDTVPAGAAPFHQIVLTAPDIDADVFETQIAPRLCGRGQRTTLYASSRDEVLNIACQLHHGRRAGDTREGLVICDGIDTVDASHVSTGFGHSVFGDVRSVVEDIALLLWEGLPPDRRPTLVARQVGARRYWEFPA